MDWLLEIVELIFHGMFHLARKTTLRDESRPPWLRNSLLVSYYACPSLILLIIFLSWKIAVIICALFAVSIVVGAFTEADDIGFH
jgi:hypothetical protein